MSKEKSEAKIQKPKKKFHKTRKVCGVSVKIFLEIFLISLMLLLIIGGLFIYHLSKDNLDIEFAREHLEKTINMEIAPYRISVGELDIDWVNIFDRPVFEINDFTFFNENDEELLSFEDMNFTLARSKMIVGEILPREITARGLDLHFVRNFDQSIQLGFVAGPSIIIFKPSEDTNQPEITSLDLLYKTYLKSLFEEGFFKGLKKLKIENSAIVFEDISKDYALSFPDIDALLRPSESLFDLDLSVQVQNRNEVNSLDLSVIYDIKFQELQTRLQTHQLNPFLWASFFDFKQINAGRSAISIDSDIQVVFDNQFNFQGADIQTETVNGTLDIPLLYDQPFEFEKLSLNGFFNRETLTFDLKNSALDAYGVNVVINGNLPVFFEDQTSYQIPLQFNVEEFNVPIPEKAFPDRFEDKPLYEWLTQKLETGTIKNLDMALDLSLSKEEEEWKGKINKLLGGFDFDDVTAIYKTTMVPLSNISGSAVVDSVPDTFTVTSESGNFDQINLTEINIHLTDVLAKKKSTADVKFQAEGEVKDFFAYLAREPINIDKNIKFDRNQVEGRADLSVNLITSTRKGTPIEEMKIDVGGDVTNLFIPKLVKELDISSDRLTFSVNDLLMNANGSGRLAGREMQFDWNQYIKATGQPYKMKIQADLLADNMLRQHFGADIDAFVTGNTGIELTYTSMPEKTADIMMRADLTPSQINIDVIGYIKPTGDPASASFKGFLQDDRINRIEALNINAPNLSIQKGSLTFLNNQISRGTFPNNKIGESDVGLTLKKESQDMMSLDIMGKRFDARPLLDDKREKKEYSGPNLNTYLEVEELLTHEEEIIRDTKVFFRRLHNGDLSQFEMDGKSGEGQVYIRYKPDESGSPKLNAEFSDAGAALRAFGLYKNVRGGRMLISGTSADPIWSGNVRGNFVLQNFSVRNAPVLAKLINAMSLPGIGQLLNNDGVVFSKLRADFIWTSRPEGSLITVRDGRTSGSELGLTFEGFIDRATSTLNMEGTIVPASTLNKLIGDIPLLGPLITGGTGALIAATYQIKGPYKETEVRINPLSALTPGIIRKILFED